jgi:hypothetical protein
LLVAAFEPHILDVLERSEIFTGDALDHQMTATPFTAQTGCRHAAVGKCELRGNIEPQGRCGRDRFRRSKQAATARLGLRWKGMPARGRGDVLAPLLTRRDGLTRR